MCVVELVERQSRVGGAGLVGTWLKERPGRRQNTETRCPLWGQGEANSHTPATPPNEAVQRTRLAAFNLLITNANRVMHLEIIIRQVHVLVINDAACLISPLGS